VDGKLDPNFREAIAQDWLNRFGGDIHQRRADVLAHFKKDPANLPLRWEQYAGEYLHRYQNTQTLLNNGLEIEPEYQQKLIAHHRALTEPLPSQLSVISDQLPVTPSVSTQPSTVKSKPLKRMTDNCSRVPENAAAYQLWEPKPIEEEASPEQLKQFWRSLKSSFLMPKSQKSPLTRERNPDWR
jgi:hypothetical protein